MSYRTEENYILIFYFHILVIQMFGDVDVGPE